MSLTDHDSSEAVGWRRRRSLQWRRRRRPWENKGPTQALCTLSAPPSLLPITPHWEARPSTRPNPPMHPALFLKPISKGPGFFYIKYCKHQGPRIFPGNLMFFGIKFSLYFVLFVTEKTFLWQLRRLYWVLFACGILDFKPTQNANMPLLKQSAEVMCKNPA